MQIEDSRDFAAAVPVLVPMPAERPYTYAVPRRHARRARRRSCEVPLGPRQVARRRLGRRRPTAIDPKKAAADRAGLRLPADRAGDAPLRRLGRRLHAVAAAAWWRAWLLRAPAAFDPEPMDRGPAAHRTRAGPDDRCARAGAGDSPRTGSPGRAPGLPHAAGVSSAVIDGLKAQGVFETVMIPPRAGRGRARSRLCGAASLTPAQQRRRR